MKNESFKTGGFVSNKKASITTLLKDEFVITPPIGFKAKQRPPCNMMSLSEEVWLQVYEERFGK